jgi:hypothetical protein
MRSSILMPSIALVPMLLVAVACSTDTGEDPTPGPNVGECIDGVGVLSGTITDDLTLTNDCEWLLRGGVFIGDDTNETVLTIDAGTQIFGETSTRGMLVIARNSKIMAMGTADAPIVFTSSKEEGTRARGDWGGLIINGNAVTNVGDEAFGEGGTGWYGGTDNNDDSGELHYVRIEFAGQLISPDNELNGIAFQAVGSGTVIDHIQVHFNADDGVEFFGGAAEWKYIVTTGIGDDNLDWTDGWVGKGQFFVGQQWDGAGGNGIEADNNGEDNDAAPRSHPTLSNLTLAGSQNGAFSGTGILLREGTAANIYNAVVVGWGTQGFDIDHDATYANGWDAGNNSLTGDLTVEGSILSNDTDFATDDDGTAPFTLTDFWNNLNSGNVTVGDTSSVLEDAFNTGAPDLRPSGGSPAASGAVDPGDAFFDSVNFRGGIDPSDDWTQGWTTSAPN